MIVVFLSLLVAAQTPGTSAKPRRTPTINFTPNEDSHAVVDTDMFDQQKYVEQSGQDSSSVKSKRASHETALTREFMEGFNQAKECDRIIFQGKGDQLPEFTVQVMVDTHDTPNQKPVWVWILRQAAPEKIVAQGESDSGGQAAGAICSAVSRTALSASVRSRLRPDGILA